MKYLVLIITLILVGSCKKAEIGGLLPTEIETQSTYSTGNERAEVNLEVKFVNQTLAEVGVAIAEKENPGTSDRVISLKNIDKDQSLVFVVDNLIKGKTYNFRAFFKNTNGEITYGNNLTLIHNFDNRWLKLESPPSSSEEYIDPEYLAFSEFGGIRFSKIDPINQSALYTSYYPNFRGWNPRFLQLNTTPFPARFNSINATIATNESPLIMQGAGHQILPNGQKLYLNDLTVYGASGYKYEPVYPGSPAETSSFGYKKLAFVFENLPNGTIWEFDFEKLKWTAKDKLPFTFEAKYHAFVINNEVYILVEPLNQSLPIKNFYKFDTEKLSWTPAADFPGENRRKFSSFTFKSNAYIGAGQSTVDRKGLKDFWMFDSVKNSWSRSFSYPGSGSINIAAVPYETNIYMGFGQSVLVNNNGGEKFKNSKEWWILDL